jgi:hypothetical protein
MHLDNEALAAGVERLRTRVAERGPGAGRAESLAHGLLWLGEVEEARQWFREAADVLRRHPSVVRGNAFDLSRLGGVLLMADDAEARSWFERACGALDPRRFPDDAQDRVLLDVVMDERAAALRDASGLAEPWPIVTTVLLLAQGDPAAARQALAAGIRKDGVAPWQTSGQAPLTLWGWLYEADRRERDVFDPVAVLREVGLWAGD